MTGETAIYDSDSVDVLCDFENENIMMEEFSIDQFDPTIIVEEPTLNVEPVETKLPHNAPTFDRDWKNYTPADLKSKSTLVTGGHVSKKRKTYQDKLTSWVSSRTSLSEQQHRAFMDQHQLKMELMRKKHAVETQMMAEKHKIELENLQLQKDILLLQKDKLMENK